VPALRAVADVDFQRGPGGSAESDEAALAASFHCIACNVQQASRKGAEWKQENENGAN
jgi:hypothetical protein